MEVIILHLEIKQINELCTGVKLAAELRAKSVDARRFLTIQGYDYNAEGKVIELSKNLNPSVFDNIYFELRCYELPNDYYINKWDVTEDDLMNEIYKDDIRGIEKLEKELSNYIQDYSILKPEWYCDNPL